MKHLFETLQERGYVYQATHEDEIKAILNSDRPVTFYLGIDPTADSLHIGHFFALMAFRYLQDAGHKGVLLIGGATAMVGDPSGKSDMRTMMTRERVEHNLNEVRTLAQRFIKTDGDNPAIIVNNADWMRGYDYIDFLRDIGIHFNVNTMLQAEAYANRIAEGGLTYMEMGYMLMQAYDFIHLNREYGCTLQIGGSDQWGNIVAGVNLGRKLAFAAGEERPPLYGLTTPLLMTADGNKMGKTEKGTLWVASDRTTTFDFFQYFYNVKDEDTEQLLKLFTRMPLSEIESLLQNIVEAKRVMAFEITKLVHGEEEAQKALDTAKALFSGGSTADAPTYEVSFPAEGLPLVDLLVDSGLIKSKSEARRMIEQGGVSIDGDKIEDTAFVVLPSRMANASEWILRAGKKRFCKIVQK
ncbi:MAG: tyrosine--tRNA ligase [Bacillota bacterium]|nr:tyrosine--tRNA ligase [Bacillota bacterium]